MDFDPKNYEKYRVMPSGEKSREWSEHVTGAVQDALNEQGRLGWSESRKEDRPCG